MTDNDVIDILRRDSALNRARAIFSGAAAAIEQAALQRKPVGPIEVRRMEIQAVEKIAAVIGVTGLPRLATALPQTAWRRLLDVSSAHLSDTTRKLMETWTPETAPIAGFASHFYGWFCWVPGPELTEPAYSRHMGKVPPDLVEVLQFAHEHGAQYVVIDADAEKLPGLRTYDDDEQPTVCETATT